MSLADNLKKLRNRLNLTQEQVSKDLNMNRATYAHYETGRREPDIETLILLSKYYNVTIDYLLETNINNSFMKTVSEYDEQYSVSNNLSKEIHNLSPESQKELKKLIELYKLKDMQKRNTEVSDELTNIE